MATDHQLRMEVTRKAAISRLNRILAKRGSGMMLKKTRSAKERARFGKWYVVESNTIRDYGFELEAFMRKCGALAEYEALGDDDA